MKLQGVVCRQRDVESARKVVGQGVSVVVEEQGVVAEGGHGYANLCQIVQVLQNGHLRKIRNT